MSFSQNRDTAFLKPDEASAVEAAVRAAVRSILKVFCELNEKRSHCYEVKLAEAERENAELKFQLKTAEQELQTLRQISSNYKISAEVTFSTDVSEGRGGEEEEEEGASFQSDGSLVIKEEPSFESTLCLKSEMADETFAAECDYPLLDNVQLCQQTPDAEMWSMQNLQTFTSARSNLNQTKEKTVRFEGEMSGRERTRKYRDRINSDPQRREAILAERRRKYQQRKAEGKLCAFDIKSVPKRKQEHLRKIWKESKKRCRAREEALNAILDTTPQSPESILVEPVVEPERPPEEPGVEPEHPPEEPVGVAEEPGPSIL
ncbi:uncharacterized protein LOC132867475 isoform X1 [Neoarius graeffei]|uniref:uncharacterized protein LOC132867475 isoform X1 n=1 Tax=Neoarius graeffei TaxID=443677 RepID=UPI00298C04D7|nr:uncharacterized protein LOC132867475 isoform X1 [Neoarius graeffei]